MRHADTFGAPDVHGEDPTADRRGSGGRARARDRVLDRAVRVYPKSEALSGIRNVENLLLFLDDDLREAGLSLVRIEHYLERVLSMLEGPRLERVAVQGLSDDASVVDQVDALTETLESLRRRLQTLASGLRR